MNFRPIAHLELAVEEGLKRGVEALPEPSAPPCDHRREHRSGIPAKIDNDPELQAFIRARIERMTFEQCAAAVTAHFPPEAMIEQKPSFGYRTVAWLLGFKSEAPNTIGSSERAERRSNGSSRSRAGQSPGKQSTGLFSGPAHIRKRPIGMRAGIEAVPSVATAPDERWSTDMCRVWAGRDGWATLARVGKTVHWTVF